MHAHVLCQASNCKLTAVYDCVCNPTTTNREYALVSGTDPRLKEDTRRVDSLDPELPRCLLMVAEEGALHDFIYVRVVRPSGPTYSVIDFPGACVRACVIFRVWVERNGSPHSLNR